MQNPHSEILLISIDAEPASQLHSLRRFGGHFAPLGLYCLAATAPDRIATLTGNDTTQFYDCLSAFNAGAVRAIILQFVSFIAADTLQKIVTRLRQQFLQARIGGCSYQQAHSELFDFTVCGTGKTSVLRILRGEIPTGLFDQQADGQLSQLAVPTELLIDGEYESHPEKWLAGRTIEVFQPWLGLLDQSDAHSTWPGLEWFSQLMNWLKQSGFQAVHLHPCGLTTERLHELRSVMLNLDMPFAASFKLSEQLQFSKVGAPLRQIWLYQSESENHGLTLEKLAQIKAADCQPCLQLDYNCFDIGADTAPLAAAERINISDEYRWPLSKLQKVTARFWRRCFFSRLFGIRCAAELIMFMKTSYNVLDILLSSESRR
ncbi:MAG: hypothetical protein KKB51_12845 [Candidatus Riflebacteria bacterium]|nr:hypothetical protein [Candidatus Riflebacteria bacterium]